MEFSFRCLRSRRANYNEVIVRVVLILLTFIVLYGVSSKFFGSADKQADAMMCKTFVKGASKLGPLDFIAGVHDKCKVEQIVINEKYSKNQSYREIAESMRRTWSKYGEGDLDLGSDFKSGNWCLLGGKVLVNNQNEYSYSDFVEWLKSNKFNSKEGEMSYYDYLNVKYFYESNSGEFDSLKSAWEAVLEDLRDGDANELKPIVANLREQFMSVQDLKLKKISNHQELYVVYKFNRLDKSVIERMQNTVIGIVGAESFVIGTAVGAVIVGSAVEGAVCGAVMGGGFFSLFTGAVGGVVGTLKGGYQALKIIFKAPKYLYRVTHITKSLSNLVKFSRFAKAEDVVGSVVNVERELEILETLSVYNQIENDVNFANVIFKFRKNYNFKSDYEVLEFMLNEIPSSSFEYKQLSSIKNVMDNIKSKYPGFDNLNMFKAGKGDSGLNNFLKKNFDASDELRSLVEDDLFYLQLQIRSSKMDLPNVIRDISKKSFEELSGEEVSEIVKYTWGEIIKGGIAGGIFLGAGVTGGTLGYNYNIDNLQYVDLMTKEEYYRSCGG